MCCNDDVNGCFVLLQGCISLCRCVSFLSGFEESREFFRVTVLHRGFHLLCPFEFSVV